MTTFLRDTLTPWLLLIGAALLIFWQSSGPLPVQTPSLPGLDKLAHAVVYALLAFLAARAFATLPLRATARGVSGAAVLFAALYGLSDEVHQAFVPGRTADIWDLAADLAGALAGAFLYYRRRPIRRRGPSTFLR
jgi:VanZ family protein